MDTPWDQQPVHGHAPREHECDGACGRTVETIARLRQKPMVYRAGDQWVCGKCVGSFDRNAERVRRTAGAAHLRFLESGLEVAHWKVHELEERNTELERMLAEREPPQPRKSYRQLGASQTAAPRPFSAPSAQWASAAAVRSTGKQRAPPTQTGLRFALIRLEARHYDVYSPPSVALTVPPSTTSGYVRLGGL